MKTRSASQILLSSILLPAVAFGKTAPSDAKAGAIPSQKNSGLNFAKAQTEDITNENFPDLIESFDYSNAEIQDVIEAISKLTGKNFIVDPQVRGKITILAPSQITVAEAYKAFLSALAINNFAVVPSGNFLKVKRARDAQKDSIETYAGSYYPDSDMMITRIIKLKYITADEVIKNLRTQFQSTNGDMVGYPPTNSIIMSDYGSNVDRVMKIIEQLDVPGFEEQLEVIRIRYAKAKDISDLITKIINKGQPSSGGFGSPFSPGIPRFRQPGTEGGGSGAESYSLVLPDDRTNSIIVVGNKAGIAKIRKLVGQLDFRLRPDESGGFYVYYVRHSESEALAKTLNGIATESKKAQEAANQPGGGTAPSAFPPRPGAEPGAPAAQAIFGGDVKITPDKNTNSLIITASKPDLEKVKNLLARIDIARDQVFVQSYIVNLNVKDNVNWGVNYYKFAPDSNGVGRIGFRGTQDVSSILGFQNDQGGVLSFGSGDSMTINQQGLPPVTISSLIGLINFFKSSTLGNLLSTPQVLALDNEEAEIEVGQDVPVGQTTVIGTGQSTTAPDRRDATIRLAITPHISPDTDTVQMKLEQKVNSVSKQTAVGNLAQSAAVLDKKTIKTQIVLNNGDTAVLGGLMTDQDNETVTKVPILGDIPVLGWLFKSKTVEKSKSNLLVFISPKIIRNQQDSAQVLRSKLDERLEFIKDNMSGRDPFGGAMDRLPRRAISQKTKAPEIDNEEEQEPEEPATESF